MLTTMILGLIALFVMIVGLFLVWLCVSSSLDLEEEDQTASGRALKEDELSEKDKETFSLRNYCEDGMFDPLNPFGPFLF